MIPRHWTNLINRYAFLRESPDKLKNNPQVAEENRILADSGKSTEKNPIAILWDSSSSYQWWRAFEYDSARDKLNRLLVPRECDPQRFIRSHPNFRRPTLDDLMEMYERPETEAEAAKVDRAIKEKRAKMKADARAEALDKQGAAIEDAIIDAESGKFQERIKIPIPAPAVAASEPKPDPAKPLKPKTRRGRPPKVKK